jgi:outer membrane lipoprotein
MKRSPHIPAVEVGSRWSIWPGFILGYLLLVAGCTPVISRQLMDQVDRNLDYRAIAADPAGTKGKMVLLGGTIVQTVPKPGRTEIDLVQKDLDYWDAPRLTDHSEGRFLVISDRFLDPAIFRQGWDVTVAGEVLEPQTRRIGDLEYHYPVIQAQELRLWRPGPPVYPYPYGGPYNWWWRNSPYYPAYPGYPYWW